MSRTELAVRYAFFAVLSTLANLAAQRLSLWIHDGMFSLFLALCFGTGVGLVVKYVLDKHWIFGDLSQGAANHAKKFSLYTLMGVFTTAIFWGSETAFWMIWRTDLAREAGAVLGLTVGYVVKYQLDKRFVFAARPA